MNSLEQRTLGAMLKLFCILIVASATRAARVPRAFTCGSQAYYTQNNGVINSHSGIDAGHHYGKNMNCEWRIEAPTGQNVELVAQQFHIEYDSACGFDWVELFDGNDTHSPSLGKFCGSNNFNPISSTQRFLTIQFVTDDSDQQSGFKFFYNFTTEVVNICGSNQFKCTNGKCIDNTYRCDNDDDCGDDSDEQHCTGTNPGGSTSSNCAADEFSCSNDGTCISNSWLCDGDDDCGDNSDERPSVCHTQTRCGATNITGASGSITSPNYPSNYPSDTQCSWFIHAPSGAKSISFKFGDNFNIEDDSGCAYDFVKLSSDGIIFSHGPYCGTTSPGTITIPGNQAYIIFTSDNSDEYTGFRLDWKALEF